MCKRFICFVFFFIISYFIVFNVYMVNSFFFYKLLKIIHPVSSMYFSNDYHASCTHKTIIYIYISKVFFLEIMLSSYLLVVCIQYIILWESMAVLFLFYSDGEWKKKMFYILLFFFLLWGFKRNDKTTKSRINNHCM